MIETTLFEKKNRGVETKRNREENQKNHKHFIRRAIFVKIIEGTQCLILFNREFLVPDRSSRRSRRRSSRVRSIPVRSNRVRSIRVRPERWSWLRGRYGWWGRSGRYGRRGWGRHATGWLSRWLLAPGLARRSLLRTRKVGLVDLFLSKGFSE